MLNAFFLLLCPAPGVPHGSALHYSELCLDIAEARMQPVLPIQPAAADRRQA